MIHRLRDMIGAETCLTQSKDCGWVRAVPLPFYGGLFDRARDAWAVLTEHAYAVKWPEAGELERAWYVGSGVPASEAPPPSRTAVAPKETNR